MEQPKRSITAMTKHTPNNPCLVVMVNVGALAIKL